LSNPLKCRANGFCGIFQDHQAEMLAGAMSFDPRRAQKLRRSRDQLLCASYRHLELLHFVGISQHYRASMCLLFHTFHMHKSFASCCKATPELREERDGSSGGPICELLGHSTTKNSAADRSTGNYLEAYTSDPATLAALYEGNVVDCELYHRAYLLFLRRLDAMETSTGLPPGSFTGPVQRRLDSIGHASQLCHEAKKASHQQQVEMGFLPPDLEQRARSTTVKKLAQDTGQRVAQDVHQYPPGTLQTEARRLSFSARSPMVVGKRRKQPRNETRSSSSSSR